MANVKSAPRGILQGVRDDSIRQIAPVPEQLPTHLPWFLTFAERGDDKVEFVSGNAFDAIFGSETLNYNGAYATHATPFIKGGLSTGNILAVQRVFPRDIAPEATLALSLDILEKAIPQYERDEISGDFILDSSGAKIPLMVEGVPVTRPGISAMWVVSPVSRVNKDGEVITDVVEDQVAVANKFGVAAISQGSQGTTDEGGAAVLSTRYPIFEFGVSFKGSKGNDIGIQLFAGHAKTKGAPSEALQEQLGQVLYGLQLVERADAASTGRILPTINSSAFAYFGLTNRLIDKVRNVDYGFGALMSNWNVDDAQGRTVGAMNTVHVYTENLAAVQALIAEKENEIDPNFVATGNAINIVDFRNIDGVTYRSVEQLGAVSGGVLLNDTAQFFAMGGDDGTVTAEEFEAVCLEQIQNFGAIQGKHYLDYARYPFHQFYDSGFSQPVKDVIPSLTGKRMDFITVLSTQDVNRAANTAEEDTGALISLVSRARVYPESTLFGTGNFRTQVAQQCGRDATREWPNMLPLTYEIFMNNCNYMGAANGRWKSAMRPDVYPNNVVTRLSNLNHTYKDDRPYNNDWDAGGIFAISNDRKTDMIPAVRTVYENPTSVLVSGANSFIFADLEYLCQMAWRRVVGNANLSQLERLAEQEKALNQLVVGRGGYDGRCQISLRAYYTDEDVANGFSSHMDVTVEGNNMPTTQTFTLIAQRLEDVA